MAPRRRKHLPASPEPQPDPVAEPTQTKPKTEADANVLVLAEMEPRNEAIGQLSEGEGARRCWIDGTTLKETQERLAEVAEQLESATAAKDVAQAELRKAAAELKISRNAEASMELRVRDAAALLAAEVSSKHAAEAWRLHVRSLVVSL